MTNGYLIDTDTCIFYFHGRFDLIRKIRQVGSDRCHVSEITIAELKFGAEKSALRDNHLREVEELRERLNVLTISQSIDIFAGEKARLQRLGTPIADFDLLIGATAIRHGLTLVTNNTKHFERMENLSLENWTLPSEYEA